jgi:hypothetical protein
VTATEALREGCGQWQTALGGGFRHDIKATERQIHPLARKVRIHHFRKPLGDCSRETGSGAAGPAKRSCPEKKLCKRVQEDSNAQSQLHSGSWDPADCIA